MSFSLSLRVFMELKLFIGSKNYSSWSLRSWFLLKVKNILFTEIRIPLYTENAVEKLNKDSSLNCRKMKFKKLP